MHRAVVVAHKGLTDVADLLPYVGLSGLPCLAMAARRLNEEERAGSPDRDAPFQTDKLTGLRIPAGPRAFDEERASQQFLIQRKIRNQLAHHRIHVLDQPHAQHIHRQHTLKFFSI